MRNLSHRKNILRPALCLALLFGLGGAPLALADKAPPPPPSSPSQADKDGFVPESRPATMKSVEEGLPAGPLVGAAYGFIWLAVFGFVVWTLRRTSRLEGELAELRDKVERATGGKK